MYVIHDCQSSTGSWKAHKLSELKDFAQIFLNLDVSWIHFRGCNVRVSDCGRYEAEKIDGRSIRDIDFIL